MKIPDFELERWKAKRQYFSKYDLTETGIPPVRLRELFQDDMLEMTLDYTTTNGSEKLREEISQLYKGVHRDQVLVTTGTSEANFIATNVLANSGDEAVIGVPTFMQIAGSLEANGVRIRWLHYREEKSFELDLDELNELVTPKTKFIVVSHPNNPTGRILDEARVRGVCEIAKDRGAWILSDEVYRGIEYEGGFSPSFAEYYDRAVVSGSLSKVFGLAGLRVGWMIGPEEVIERGWAYREYTSLSGSPLTEALAEAALSEDVKKRLIERGRGLARRNFSIFSNWLDGHKDIFSCIKPKFGVISLIRQRLGMNSYDFCERLFREKSVAVVPGEVFEMKNYLRLSFCLEEEPLKEAFNLIDELIDELKVKVKL